MMTKREWCRIFTVTALVFTTTLVWMAQPCIAGGGKYTYKKGFTSQKIDQEIKKRIQGRSYKKGAKISLSSLRYVQEGEMIVNKKIARRTLKAFYQLYKLRYPIEKMKLVDEYEAEDEASMADNNTSAFNYRKVANSNKLSKHSLGLAIDINPRINPYITSYGIAPANSRAYRVREISKCKGKYKDYMIHRGDKVYKIFKKYGFSWGGDWKHSKDYQHFEAV